MCALKICLCIAVFGYLLSASGMFLPVRLLESVTKAFERDGNFLIEPPLPPEQLFAPSFKNGSYS